MKIIMITAILVLCTANFTYASDNVADFPSFTPKSLSLGVKIANDFHFPSTEGSLARLGNKDFKKATHRGFKHVPRNASFGLTSSICTGEQVGGRPVFSSGAMLQVWRLGAYAYLSSERKNLEVRGYGAMGIFEAWRTDNLVAKKSGSVLVSQGFRVGVGVQINKDAKSSLFSQTQRRNLVVGAMYTCTYGGFGVGILVRIAFEGENPFTGNRRKSPSVGVILSFGDNER